MCSPSNDDLYHRIQCSGWFVDYGEKFRSNVNALCRKLKRGEHFAARNGKLEVRKNQSLCAKIHYFFTRRRQEAAVRGLITDTVVKLKGNDSILQTLFFDRLAHLSVKIFDRKATITKETAALLCPELQETDRSKMGKVARRIAKTRLALKLGIGLKPISKGAGGSYFARDYKMKVIGVFKPGSEESLGSNSPKLLTRIRSFFMKKLFHIDTSLPFWSNEGYLAEVMSSKLASALGIDILPPSQVAVLTGVKGSFQIFAKDTESADEAFHLRSMGCNVRRNQDLLLRTVKQEQFEQMALLDIAIANRDRHFENFLVKDSLNEWGQRDIVLIDHGLAFPRVNPPKNDRLYARNQYKWALMPHSARPFSGALSKRAEDVFRGPGLMRLLEAFKEVNDPHGKGFSTRTEWGSSQEYAFKERTSVLLIAMKNKMTIREIARMKSKEDLAGFLDQHGIKNEKQMNQFLQISEVK
jgi:hypothetical protein